MSELASKLQQKMKTYKQQIEEAEEIAALNLAKFRHTNTISVTDPHYKMVIQVLLLRESGSGPLISIVLILTVLFRKKSFLYYIWLVLNLVVRS